jgi:uncharacterized protein YpmS
MKTNLWKVLFIILSCIFIIEIGLYVTAQQTEINDFKMPTKQFNAVSSQLSQDYKTFRICDIKEANKCIVITKI